MSFIGCHSAAGRGGRRLVWLSVCVAVMAVMAVGGSTAAARTSSSKAKTLVVLGAKDRSHVARRALKALRSQLSDTTIVLKVVWIPLLARSRAAQIKLSKRHAAGEDVLAVAWFDARQPNEILMLAARTKRLVVRRVSGASVGSRLEALAIIVRTSMLALLAGQPLPTQPPPRRLVPRHRDPPRRLARPRPVRPRRRRVVPKRPVVPRRVLPRRRSIPRRPVVSRRTDPPSSGSSWRFGLGLEAGYFLSGYSTKGGAVHGGELAVKFRLRKHWEVLASYRVTQQVTGRVATSRLDVQPHPIGLGVRWRHRWGRIDLSLALSVIMDYATLSTEVEPTTHIASTDRGDLLWSVMPAISGAVRLVRRLRLILSLGAQIGLNWRRYVLADQSTTEPFLSPWPVQPCLMIGLSADIL